MAKEFEASLNVVVIPDGGVVEAAIHASDKISRHFPIQIKLDKRDFIPHITLYQARYPGRNIGRIREKLEIITKNTRAFMVEMDGVFIELDTYVFWKCKKSAELQRLHNLLVDALNPLREGLVLPHLARVTGMGEKDRADIDKYGNVFYEGKIYASYYLEPSFRKARI